jgi:hypothetical protein
MVMLFVFDSVEFVREQVFVAEDESGAYNPFCFCPLFSCESRLLAKTGSGQT